MIWSTFAQSLSASMSQYSVRILLGAVIAVFVLLVFASALHHRYHFTKKSFYAAISTIVIVTTIALTAINLRLIASSEDGSIARLEGKMSIFACGQEITIKPDSMQFNQSSGDARHHLYPNGDLEFIGYRTAPETDGSLGTFMRAIGGSMSSNVITLPYNDATAETIVNSAQLTKFIKTNPLGEKYLELRSGESCDKTPSMINVFIYSYSPTLNSFSQSRIIQTPEKYILSNKPFNEADCIVVVYGEPSDKTTLTCQGYPKLAEIQTSQLEETEN